MILDRLCLQAPGVSSAQNGQLLYNAEKRDATVVIAVAPVTFVLVQCDNVCILHVLWYPTFSAAKTEDFIQPGAYVYINIPNFTYPLARNWFQQTTGSLINR